MSGLHAEADALARDAADALAPFRDEFVIPPHGPAEQVYFCGNSLGLQPRATRQALLDELDDWGNLAVEAHFRGRHPWMPYHAEVRTHLAELVGAEPGEVVAMNSLTVNLHLMMVSFYRPTAERPAILIEKHAFPSDRHAVESQIRFHGFDPVTALIEIDGDEPGGTISMQAIERALDQHGRRIALVLWPGVQYLTGQAFDGRAIAGLARARGCNVGFDLAHAVGNVPVDLHDSGADFAVWCSYKYLNSGPGAVAGCFVHARHARSGAPRFAGWWGHDQATRFREALQMPLILLGGISELATAERGLAAGFDFVAMARAILHHPDIINEWANDTGTISGCIHCNRCMPTIYTGTRCPLVDPRPGDRPIDTPPWAAHVGSNATRRR